MATNRRDRIAAARSALFAEVTAYQNDVQAVKSNKDASDSFKARRAAELRAQYDASGRRAATEYRKAVTTAIDGARQDLARALQEQEGSWNYGRLTFLQAEYAARLSMPLDPLRHDKSVIQRIASEYTRARAADDREAKRALRLAAAQHLANVDSGDDDALQTATALRRAFEDDAAAERVATAAFEAELRDLAREERDMPGMVLQAESAITGASPSALGPPTPWSYAVLDVKPNIGKAGSGFAEGMAVSAPRPEPFRG